MKDNNKEFFEILWENWQTDSGGKGRCSNCPAHWSVREDFKGDPEKRESSFQHRPLYGEGNLDADIAIFGMEPGPVRGCDSEQNRRKQSFWDVRHDNITGGGTIQNANPLFETIALSNFTAYYTQMKKCNEMENNNANSQALRQCVGLGNHEGYIRDELSTVDPTYIVTFGKFAFDSMREVLNLKSLGADNFTTELTKGETTSGLRMVESHDSNIDYKLFPAPHPNPQGAWQVWKPLDIENTKRYYKYFAEDLIEAIKN